MRPRYGIQDGEPPQGSRMGAAVNFMDDEELLLSSDSEPMRPGKMAAFVGKWIGAPGGLYLTSKRLVFIPLAMGLGGRRANHPKVQQYLLGLDLSQIDQVQTSMAFPVLGLTIMGFGMIPQDLRTQLTHLVGGGIGRYLFTSRLSVRADGVDYVFDVGVKAGHWVEQITSATSTV